MGMSSNLKTVLYNEIGVILFRFATFSTVIHNYQVSNLEFVAVTSSLSACTGYTFLLSDTSFRCGFVASCLRLNIITTFSICPP